MRHLFVLTLCLCFLGVSAKEKKYPVTEIPLNLLHNAHAVKRIEQIEFVIKNPASAELKVKFAVTVLNQKGVDLALFYNHYSGKKPNLMNFNGVVYNALGEEVDKIKKSDFDDQSVYDGISIHSDDRIQYVEYQYKDYPYTLEYEYTLAYDAMMFYPSWSPIDDEHLSVQQSSFMVSVPKDMHLRYKEINLLSGVTIDKQEEAINYRWTSSGLAAVDGGEAGAHWEDTMPKVLIGPHKFTFEGYSGDMSTWQSYGKWQKKLNSELGPLPENIVATVKDLTKSTPHKLEKIRRVYKYLQENTRYVSIQLGIGGWQPFDPTVVSETGYGDCKALTYYTKSMLEAIDIRALYTLVRAGRSISTFYTDFPSSQFNHVFLCVPLEQDTVWLECTDQTNPFGYLGGFTSDRPVLLVTENGGKLVRTPALTADQNQKISNMSVKISEDGSAVAHYNTVYKGIFSETPQRVAQSMSVEDRKKWIYNNSHLPTFTINQLNFKVSGDFTPEVHQQLSVDLKRAVSLSGKRMFLQANLTNRLKSIPKEQTNRTSDLILKYDQVIIDTVTFEIPPQFHPEYVPAKTSLEEEFANYSYEILDQAGTLKMIRRLEYKKGRYSPEQYQKYREFCQAVVKADKSKVVFKSST